MLASASPIAVRLAARSLDRLGTPPGRLFSISTAGSIAGTFATAFWLVPELGTDQVFAVGGVTLLVAASVFAWPSGSRPRRRSCVAAAVAGSRSPRRARDRAASRRPRPQLVAALPDREKRTPGELTGRRARARRAATTCARLATRATTGCSCSTTRTRRYLRFDSTFQSGDAARATRTSPVRVHRLPPARPRLLADRDARALHRARRRLGAQAHVARLPRSSACTRSRSIPDVVRVAHRWFALHATRRLASTPRTAGASCRRTTSAGT